MRRKRAGEHLEIREDQSGESPKNGGEKSEEYLKNEKEKLR